tara:strand:+ start:16899 stop:17132 length:234 start_codon:yes stop_codon:yes gene_type:complete
MVPPELEELQQELQNHPDLLAQLNPSSCKTFADGIAIIAAHCDVAMDGEYSVNDMRILFGVLVRKLQDKRSIIIGIH